MTLYDSTGDTNKKETTRLKNNSLVFNKKDLHSLAIAHDFGYF